MKTLVRRSVPAWLYELAHQAKIRVLRLDDYNRVHARAAHAHCRRSAARVLVIGCNTGGDCRLFLRLGAGEVIGLDVIADVGRGFRHRRVSYCRASAERMPFADASFDLVYSVATMEHVQDVERAFAEMARVTAPGGTVYSYAAPLWNSRFGHHKSDLFPDAPWIHLRMSEDEIVGYAGARGITAPGGIANHVHYMLSDAFFNKAPARRYVEACAGLPGMQPIRNYVDRERADLLHRDIADELAAKGYSPAELLAAAHLYIARKQVAA